MLKAVEITLYNEVKSLTTENYIEKNFNSIKNQTTANNRRNYFRENFKRFKKALYSI